MDSCHGLLHFQLLRCLDPLLSGSFSEPVPDTIICLGKRCSYRDENWLVVIRTILHLSASPGHYTGYGLPSRYGLHLESQCFWSRVRHHLPFVRDLYWREGDCIDALRLFWVSLSRDTAWFRLHRMGTSLWLSLRTVDGYLGRRLLLPQHVAINCGQCKVPRAQQS